ncbi:TPA: hypothetical protein N0F65_000402 [Lagenidium giganteum]|uniref:Cytoplasmic dynein 2 heavy chain 1 n=1 Tax=Lagenidium giganteum TaxID=4803 RepID=A0AAV2Z127_9STRA|nr:TPA: hypothetical protein N0F65_000402 [Lagenidium giganteum]
MAELDPAGDERRSYVLSLIKCLWGRRAQVSGDKASSEALALFLDDPTCSVLQARALEDDNNSDAVASVTLSTKLQADWSQGKQHETMVLVKRAARPLTPDNMRATIQVSSLLESPLHSLYQAVHKVYAPMLLQNDERAGQLSQKLKDMLLELDAGLGASMMAEADAKPKDNSNGGAALLGIATILDEFQYWERSDQKNAKRASKFSAAFDNIHQRYTNLSALSCDEMFELLEETYNTVDDIWRADLARENQYPQARMEHLLGLIGTAINTFIMAKAKELPGGDIWTSRFHDVSTLLQQAIGLCEKWSTSIDTLTSTMWPSYDEHPWKGSKSTQDVPLQCLIKRMEDIVRLRTTYEELISLLPRTAANELTTSCFQPFRSLQPLYYNAYTDNAWHHAVKEFESTLAPVEAQVAAILRDQLSSVTGKPSTAVRLLQRYRQLLQRPSLAKALAGERDALLAQLMAHLDQLDSDFESRRSASGKDKAMHIGKTLSAKVNVIVWGRMLSTRVHEMQTLARHVLADLPAFKSFTHACDAFLTKANGLVLDKVRAWQEQIEAQLDGEGEDSLRLSGKLMQIDKNGDLVVNYSEFLVTLLRDVRQLTELSAQHNGSTSTKPAEWVPLRVRKVAEEAEKYYRYGVTLKKVANFYNNMESQIIDEQKPMLLDSLLAFEEAVKRPGLAQKASATTSKKDVTWQNLEECNEYVKQLQEAADKLSSENRRFKRAHEKLSEEFVGLIDIDLLRYPTKWKDKWDDIKKNVLVVTKKQDPARTKKWFLFWDHQLYKVLECGYQLGLEMLNENLPEIKEIKTELHFPPPSSTLTAQASTTGSSITLVLKPPMEELRTTYYKAMKKFVSRPTKFGGFANPQVFAAMCDANAKNLVNVYTTCEQLFARLESMLYEYEHWSMLSRMAGSELDTIMETELQEPGDWELNFKTLKAKRKDSEKIPDFCKIDCLHVSLVPFKHTLDEYMQRFQDGLLLSLRKSWLGHLKIVEEFVDQAMEKLNKRPHSIEEISQAQLEWKEIDAKRNTIQIHFQKADKKKTLLLSVLGSASGNQMDTTEVENRFAQLPTRWENFEIALEAFNDMIEEQRESLKGEIEAQIVDCNVEIGKFRQRWTALRPVEVASWEDEALAKVYTAMEEWKEKLLELKTRSKQLTENCVAFNMNEPSFDGLSALEIDVDKINLNWTTYKQFREEVAAIAAQDWITFCSNMFALQDCAQKWSDAVKQTTEERTSVVDKIQDFFNHVKRAMPTLKLCRGEPFKDDHWTQLFRKLGMPRHVEKRNLTVGHFIDVFDVLETPATLQFVKVLHARAQGEVTIREALQELRAWTETAELSLLAHEHDGRRVSIIKDWKDITLALGDNQSLLASLKESQFFKPFEGEAIQYEVKMSLLDQALTQLNIIQRKWVFLEPIFSKGALPSEQGRFRRVDDEFTEIMHTVEKDPKLFNLADEMLFPQLLDRLNMMVDQLERCQKALADFLEEKRSRMPRFYFIGDEDLLEILGQSQNPSVIQSHLKKLYQGVHRVEFSEQRDQIVAMLSSANEKVVLHSPVQITSAVEEWLEAFTTEMRRTIRLLVAKCANSKAPDYQEFPSQVLCLAEQVRFCQQAEEAIKSGTVADLKQSLLDTMRELTSLDLSTEMLMQLKVKALVLDLVHHIDVCDQLTNANCRSTTDWIWQKQLRFYLDKQQHVRIRTNDAEFDYTYEYQGNAPKLVHTPLTDKCYLTLTQGMHMGFGGNPYGPAGTGKTESVKALGGQFGRQVLVFNCDEGIDFQSMGRIFIGLVKCGAWGCFDEFNRLKEDQLSAISQQIQVIQDAIRDKTVSIKLLNRTVDVDFNAGIFVTLNPAGKGYGGRSKLPDNLKALFRPVAMGRPDNNLIAEVILYSEGFGEAKDIASKVVSLYKLSGQLLSPQQHYDWGLRALKAVLNTAGKLLQAAKKEISLGAKTTTDNEGKESKERMTTAQETEILIKAVRINTLSKLTFVDSTRFLALIGDVFPGVTSADLSGGELEAAIREVMVQKPFFLQIDEIQIRKMLQLKESLDQRMGCVVVGPSGSGKSTVWQVLQQALIKCGQLVKTHVMNPKSMPRERLLGHMDLDTREWEDGVLTDAARKVVKEPESVRSWIICDGDVDPEWIESLNSVLDDNHLLTLPNGERINFGPNVNFVFETHDLRFASPATISRMGMIFLSDEDMDIKRLVSKWLLTLQPEDRRENLRQWIDELFTKALEELHKYDMVVETTTVGTIMNGFSHVATATTRSEFVGAIIRGLGANLAMSSRASFAKSMFMMSNERPPDISAPLDCYCQGSTFYMYETKRDTYGSMDGRMDRKDLASGLDAVVPTVSVQRGLKIIEPWVDKMEPFILVGPEGAGKNMLIRQAFKNLKNVTVTVLHCNAQTTADHIIHKISQCCSLFSTNNGRVYRPRDCERLVLYLKDINLPKPDQYDTCMLIAFLQQLITFNGFYDQHLEFLGIEKVQIVASMNAATTVGRHPLSTRFTAIVKVAYMDYPTTEELMVVYSTFLEGVFSPPTVPATWKEPSNRDKLARSLVEIFDATRSKFNVDEQRHYQFTPRDLTKWVFSLVRYDLEHEEILDVLSYEARRLFRDRLVDQESVAKFDGIVNSVLKQQWRHAPKLQDVYFSSLHNRKGSSGADAETGGVAAASPLARVGSDDFSQVISQGIVLYEREEKDLHMLLFDEILDHVAIVERILSEPGGSILLVGNSGVGRRSATTLVAYMLGYTMFSPSATRNYDAASFRTDLKSILVKAGVEGQHYVLYLEDHHFTQDAILEITNSLLSSGEVPGLYTHEEIEPQIAPLKEKMLESIGSGEHRTVYDFFVSRVCQYVHVVLGMDSRHPQFLMRCESNPALYTRCAIVWMGEWNNASMKKIPELLLNGSELVDSLPKTTKLIASLYETSKEYGATPREFVCFLGSWRSLFEAKCKQNVLEIKHLKSGLSKLEEASATVDELSKNAAVKKKELSAAQTLADEAMDEIKNALDKASINRREVEELKKQLAKAEEATNGRKREIEQELGEITPILQSAKEAVGNIKSDNLNEIRSLKMPPEPIHDVLSAVLMLLGIQDTSWNSMKKFLGNRGVKDDILNYDARRITPDISKAVTKLVKSKASSFDHETIYRVSVAAAPLATWVKANLKYSMVLNKIEPLEADLAEAKRSLEASQQRLQQCESELKKIDVKVDKMKAQFAEKTKEAEILRVGLERAESTLDKAQGLLGKLGGEKKRWSEQVKELESRLLELPIRMLLAAAFTTFLGKCSEDARARIIREWERDVADVTGVTSTRSFDYRKMLSSESELLTWKSMGLPADNLSMENALIVVNSAGDRCPFIIDPANACTSWLQAELAKDTTRPLSIVQSQDARFVSLVEQAVRFGKTLVILEVDFVEPYLYPLVRKDLIHQGPRYVVSLGDKVIDYNENFRLYLVTRNPSPPLAPDALAIVNVINFTVTKSGLEGQLLGVTIQHEQPELEQEKSELLKHEEDCKVQLAALEKKLVEALATSEGDILENTILIESLTRTKATSADIEEALEKSAKKSEELDEKRDSYRPFAHEGAKMFFLVKQLSAVNHMYRFSLASFLTLFKATLGTKMESSSTKDRIFRLIPILEYKVLMYIGRAIFKEHRPMFGMHLVNGMHDDCFEKNEYEFFCGDLLGDSNEKPSSGSALPEWASPERKEAFSRFVETFPRLAQMCKFDSHDLWIRWSKSAECEQTFHAKMEKSGSSGGLSAFQKVLVVQALRPDRLQSAIINFICSVMQLKSLTPPPIDFKAIVSEEATNMTPVLVLTTAGADPSKELEEVATAVVGKGHYYEVAMGGGQQEKALSLLKSTAEHGEWLCLQNLHLVVAWLPILEKEINALQPHHKFRLWLTTEPHDGFPLVLLEQSLKITFESPPGMKKNLQRTYAAWSSEFISKGTPARAQLLFLLAFFHALLQERRTYIPQGWTKFYEFSFGDFRAGSNVMELACKGTNQNERGSGIDWQTLHGLMENAIYGGRIDNPYDLRVLRCNLSEYFSPEFLSGQKSLVRGVKMPQSSRHEDFVDIIDHLPDTDAPAMFGLPDNIERSAQRTMSAQVIAQLKALSSSEEAAEKFDREKWRAQLGPLIENWGKWTTSFSTELNATATANTGTKNLHLLSPVDAFVALENEYALDLAQQVNVGIQGLKKVIYGTGLLTPAIQTIARALLKGAVPNEWSAKWEGSESVQTWLRSLALRKRALNEWQDAASSGKLLSHGLDLSDLLHPGTFLNALRQQSARELKCSMDGMKLISCWEKDKLSSGKGSHEWFEITHLLLQGASFEGGALVEASSDAQELVTVPSCFVTYARDDAVEMYTKDTCIKVPLYYSTSRERLLVEISMPIAGDHARWILAGVALFLSE